METKPKQWSKKSVGIVVALFVAFIIYSQVNSYLNAPISAEGMSVEERTTNDAAALKSALKDENVDLINFDYKNDSISIYIDMKSTDQYVDDKAADIELAVKDAIEQSRSKLTLEKENYTVFVFGKDGRLIN